MKMTKLIKNSVIAGLFLTATTLSAQTANPALTLEFKSCEKAAHANLADAMDAMGNALGQTVRNLRGSNFEAASENLKEFECANLQALVLLPTSLEALPDAAKPAAVAQYKAGIADVLQHGLLLQIAVLEKDMTKIGEQLDALQKIREAGHSVFIIEE